MTKKLIFVLMFCAFNCLIMAQPEPMAPGPPPPDPGEPVPIGGLEFLLIGGAALGIKKVISSKKKG